MKKIKEFIRFQVGMLQGWLFSKKSLYSTTLCAKVFYGWQHFKYAKLYADRRNKIDNKCYYVLPFGEDTLIVVNRLEMTALKTKGVIKKELKHNDVLEMAYYRALTGGVRKEF